MAYPDRMLDEDERVVVDLRPHWRVLVIPSVFLIAAAGLTSYAAAALPAGRHQEAGRLAVAALGVLVVGVLCLRPFLRWRTTHFVVTTSRLLVRTGLIARRSWDVALDRIGAVVVETGLVERLLGSGTLVVELAGENGRVALEGVPHVTAVSREISRLTEAHRRRY